ncbi:Peptidase C15 pyroglutamyl peptidase I [Methylocella tundrae]|uniref:Pyroglutamyl-peptidase I n=2 Tax=Methylocella tundrae TaxID=227605 RepID=A0A8B6M7B2_METTU|nr:Peptidase C15 pyroglutamyl peptidase I [Methylocella tundrae]
MSEWPPIMSGMRPPPLARGPGAPLRILVTGFAGFPGSPKNPTAKMMAALASYRLRLALTGIRLEPHVLPVIYAEIAPRLVRLQKEIEPDAILHFGVATRRTKFCVEARALNRVSILHPDASGATAPRRAIIAGAPMSLTSSVPCGLIAAELRRNGFAAAVSTDAGDYVCNQTLFLSLNQGHMQQNHAPLVGFVHVPPLAVRYRRGTGRFSLDDAVRAALVAIRILAPALRSRRALIHRPAP